MSLFVLSDDSGKCVCYSHVFKRYYLGTECRKRILFTSKKIASEDEKVFRTWLHLLKPLTIREVDDHGKF